MNQTLPTTSKITKTRSGKTTCGMLYSENQHQNNLSQTAEKTNYESDEELTPEVESEYTMKPKNEKSFFTTKNSDPCFDDVIKDSEDSLIVKTVTQLRAAKSHVRKFQYKKQILHNIITSDQYRFV